MSAKQQARVDGAWKQPAPRQFRTVSTPSEPEIVGAVCCAAILLLIAIRELRAIGAPLHEPQILKTRRTNLVLRQPARRTTADRGVVRQPRIWAQVFRDDPVLKKTWDKPTPDNIAVVRRPRKKGLTYCQISLTTLGDQGIDIPDDRGTPLDSLLDAEGAQYDFDAEGGSVLPSPDQLRAMARSAARFTATADKPTEHVAPVRGGTLP